MRPSMLDRTMKTRRNICVYIGGILLLSMLITLAIPMFEEVTVYDQVELSKVACGFPLPFVLVDESNFDPPLPYDIQCSLGGWEKAASFGWIPFIADALIFTLILLMMSAISGYLLIAFGFVQARYKESLQTAIRYFGIAGFAIVVFFITAIAILILTVAFTPAPQINTAPPSLVSTE